VVAIVDGSDVFGVAATNNATKLVLGAGAVALLVVAMMPRVGRKRDRVVERDRSTADDARFARDRPGAEEPVTTTERRV
jgi:threonine dehydrogenase-like Zn-dependent dehydrogenase